MPGSQNSAVGSLPYPALYLVPIHSIPEIFNSTSKELFIEQVSILLEKTRRIKISQICMVNTGEKHVTMAVDRGPLPW